MHVLVKGERGPPTMASQSQRLELSGLFEGLRRLMERTENRSLVICVHTSRRRVGFAVASPSGYGLDGGAQHSKALPQICKRHTSRIMGIVRPVVSKILRAIIRDPSALIVGHSSSCASMWTRNRRNRKIFERQLSVKWKRFPGWPKTRRRDYMLLFSFAGIYIVDSRPNVPRLSMSDMLRALLHLHLFFFFSNAHYKAHVVFYSYFTQIK